MRRAIVVATAVVVAWLVLAPSWLGGQLSYVVTHGTSMLPHLHAGDLAVLWPGDYEVGDVIAYHSDTLDTVVLHRIVDVRGERYVTQGDNNSWLDPDHPTPRDVHGELGLRIPNGAAAVEVLRSPFFLTSLAAAALIVLSARRRTTRKPTPMPKPTTATGRPGAGVLACAGAAVLLAVLTVTGFVIPSRDSQSTDTTNTARMVSWQYSASVPVTTTYPTGRVSTGDPIFLKLVDRLAVTAHDGPVPLPATALSARVSTHSGWRGAVPIAASARGNAVEIDLRALAARLNQVSTETAVNNGVSTLTVTADIGSGWRPTLRMAYDGTQLRHDPATLTSTHQPGPAAAPSTFTAITDKLRHELIRLRWLLGTATLLLVLAATLLARHQRRAPAKHGLPHGAIDATTVTIPVDRVVVDVPDKHALRRAARRTDRPLIHHHTGRTTTCLVDDGFTVYRHTSSAGTTHHHTVFPDTTAVPAARRSTPTDQLPPRVTP